MVCPEIQALQALLTLEANGVRIFPGPGCE